MLEVKSINSQSEEAENIRKLYKEVYPQMERFPFDLLVDLSEMPHVSLNAVYDGDNLIASSLLIEGEKAVYIAFLAVLPSYRLQGYGTAVINQIKDTYQDKYLIFDERSQEDNESASNVRDFFAKNGITSTGYLIDAFGDEYEIFSSSKQFDFVDYLNIFKGAGFNEFNPRIIKQPE